MYWNRLNLDSYSQDTYHLPINFGTSWAKLGFDIPWPTHLHHKTQLQKVDMNLMQNLHTYYFQCFSVCNPLVLAIFELPECARDAIFRSMAFKGFAATWVALSRRPLAQSYGCFWTTSSVDVTDLRNEQIENELAPKLQGSFKKQKLWMEMETNHS